MLSYSFWFSQPSIILDRADQVFGYIFAALIILTIVFFIVTKFIKHPIHKKPLRRLGYLVLTESLLGLLWFGMRYENTPIFASRYWAGLVWLIGCIWLVFILKYLVFNFRKESLEYNREQLKSRYIPGKRS